MDYLDVTLEDSEQSLALDEDLLDQCERFGRECLRVWQPTSPCVVAGHSNRSFDEIDLLACRRLDIPVLRRHSGGGSVLLGPGCLNYSLVLNARASVELSGIRSTNSYVMGRLKRAVSEVTRREIDVSGFTDLAVGGRKFSGNAQYRRRNGILFHGTLMLNLDIGLIEATLAIPAVAPGYREGRSHRDFLTNLHESADDVKMALRLEWGATPPDDARDRELPGQVVRADAQRGGCA